MSAPRRLGALLLATLAAVPACSSDAGSVDPDAIESRELAAVQRALNAALADDTVYRTLAQFVLPFVDRASRLPNPEGDSTRLVGIELDIRVETDQGLETAELSTILAWRGYDPTTRTMDTVFFVAGAGLTPVDAQLAQTFSPDQAGTGTGVVIHEDPDSTATAWLSSSGRLVTTSNSYGAARSQSSQGLTLSVARGSLSGSFEMSAQGPVPDATSTVTTAVNFVTGARAMKVQVRGRF